MLDAASTSPVSAAPPDALGLDLPSPKSPARPNLDEIEAMVRRAEARLKLWFDAVPEPSLEQLDIATLALWRMTSVHKTLYFFRQGEYARRCAIPLPKEFLRSIRVMEETLDLLHPPKPKSPKSQAKTMPPLPPLPSGMSPLPPLPPLPSMRVVFPPLHPPQRKPPVPKPEPQPEPASEPASKSWIEFENPRPVSDCPKLRNPMHTAQAVMRQADKLCTEAGLPDPDPADRPVPTLEAHIAAPEIPAADSKTYASIPAYEPEDGPGRGRREWPPAKRSAAGGAKAINSRPSVGARFPIPNHAPNPHDPP